MVRVRPEVPSVLGGAGEPSNGRLLVDSLMASRSLSLDQFIALNEEMAALVRAGVPLDRGLIDLGKDLRGQLGGVAAAMGKRLESGTALEEIVNDPALAFPPLYRAVIVAGLRSGNLAAALQGLASTTRRVREMRRIVGVALAYPLFVAVVAVLLFAALAREWAPAIAQAYRQWEVPTDGLLGNVLWLGERAGWWAPWVPLLLVTAVLIWWIRSGRAAKVRTSGWISPLVWVPTLARMSKAGRMASYTEVLRLLIEHRTPLPQALRVAGEASGDRRLQEQSQRVAQGLEYGGEGGEDAAAGFPPLLAWLLASGAPESQLVSALGHASQAYRNEALRMAQWLSVYLPLIFTAAIGGTVVFLYSLAILGPVFSLFHALGQP
jgi:general secretion pathway protein F